MYSPLFAAYLIGSLSFAVIVSKYYGMDDPRTYGSGNPGATNVLRSGKKKAAALTLLGDAVKGLVAVILARCLQDALNLSDATIALVAIAALVGHMWPIFFNFKGGKGVATALGVLLALLSPRPPCSAPWFRLVMAFGFKYLPSPPLVATVCAPIFAFFMMPHASWAWATVFIAALVLYRHKSNIQNLIQGKESRIGDKAGKS